MHAHLHELIVEPCMICGLMELCRMRLPWRWHHPPPPQDTYTCPREFSPTLEPTFFWQDPFWTFPRVEWNERRAKGRWKRWVDRGRLMRLPQRPGNVAKRPACSVSDERTIQSYKTVQLDNTSKTHVALWSYIPTVSE